MQMLWLHIYRADILFRPPPLSGGQNSWLQIQRSGFDSRRYQIFGKVVGLGRGPLNLVSTNELLGEKGSVIWGEGMTRRFISEPKHYILLNCNKNRYESSHFWWEKLLTYP
jgi:hypothetical protein